MTTRIVAKSVLFFDDKILIVRRSGTDTRRPHQWDLPGGEVDEGEDIGQAAAREIEEEIGLTIDPRHLDLVFTQTDIYKKEINIIRLFFVGRVTHNSVTLSHEHDQFQWLTIGAAIDMKDGYHVHQKLFRYIRDNDLVKDLPL